MRTLKSRGIRSFAFVAPTGIRREEAVRAIVEGAHVGNFDPDYYRSDRKDQKIDAITVVASGDKSCAGKSRERSANHRRIPELHSRSGQRTFQPHDADHPRGAREKNVRGSRIEVRSVWGRQDQRNEDGRLLERRPGFRRATCTDRDDLRTSGRAAESPYSGWSEKELPSTPAAFRSSPPTAWRR